VDDGRDARGVAQVIEIPKAAAIVLMLAAWCVVFVAILRGCAQ
jgi:hypothetical protein